MKKLVSTLNMSHEEWLEWRKNGIGGSDAAAIVGLTPWASPFTVYADKLGLVPEQGDNEAMRQGRDLEEYVAQRFREATGKRVRRCNAIIRHPDHEFLLANVDRLVSGEAAGLECKTMNPRSPAASALEEGNVPPQYYVQCQHYMAVTGLQRWYLAILVLGSGFYWFKIPRHEGDIEALLSAEVDFWHNHIIPCEPPAPDGSDACTEALKGMYLNAINGAEIMLPDCRDALNRLKQIGIAAKVLEQEKTEIENTLRLQMQDAEIAHTQGWRITLKNIQRSTLDSKALKADHPELYEQYKKTSVSRRLTVKEED